MHPVPVARNAADLKTILAKEVSRLGLDALGVTRLGAAAEAGERLLVRCSGHGHHHAVLALDAQQQGRLADSHSIPRADLQQARRFRAEQDARRRLCIIAFRQK